MVKGLSMYVAVDREVKNIAEFYPSLSNVMSSHN